MSVSEVSPLTCTAGGEGSGFGGRRRAITWGAPEFCVADVLDSFVWDLRDDSVEKEDVNLADWDEDEFIIRGVLRPY